MLNNTLLENSDFITGAFPAEYGNALSGVFDLRMRNGNNEQYEFLGQIGFNGFEVGAEGPISRAKGSSFLVNYRYSTMDVLDRIGMDFGTMGVPHYQDLSFKLSFPNTPLGHISMFGLGGLSNIEIWDSRKDTTKQQLNFYGGEGWDITSGSDMGTIGLSSHYTINPNTFLKVTIAGMAQVASNLVDTLNLQLDKFRFYESYMTDNRLTAGAVLNHRFNPQHTLKGGVSVKMLYSDFHDQVWSRSDSEYFSQLDFKGNTYLVQPYVQWQFRPNDRITMNTGLAYNMFAFNRSQSIEPRLGIRYGLTNRQSVCLGYGLHSQISPLFVYFLQERQPDGTYMNTNTNLGLTRSHHVVLGYDHRINQYTRIKVETYYQHIFDAPVDAEGSNSFSILNNGASFEFGMPSSYLINKGLGENYGVEITLERFLNRGMYFLLTASLFESKYTGSDNNWFNTAFNNNYVVNGLFGKEFYFGRNNSKAKRSLAIDLKTMVAGGKRNPMGSFF